MLMSQGCIDCLRKSFVGKRNNPDFLREVENLLENRKDSSAPEIVYYYNQILERYYGKQDESKYIKIKSTFNQLLLKKEKEIQEKIDNTPDPLFTSLLLGRIGNYIDFSALGNVEPEDFLSRLFSFQSSELDQQTYSLFLEKCEKAKFFLLLADNCGEIVLDKIFLQELKKRFPHLTLTTMVRGGIVSNDVTMEDALEIGLDQVCKVITNGMEVAGTVYRLLGNDEQKIVEEADVIVSKGQANYESMVGSGFEVFYSFLCKCEMFSTRFNVEPLTGMFVLQK